MSRLLPIALTFCLVIAGWRSVLAEDAVSTQLKPLSFELDVQPILTARGCNQGACHGKARGQNGFQLSLLGFDSDFDYAALTQQARGRRIFPAAPERSLLLAKAAAMLPHGGGVRLEKGSADYEVVLKWIEQGAPRRLADEPKLVAVTVSEGSKFLRSGEGFSLKVTARYSDGSSRDVTSRTQFQSSEMGIVSVGQKSGKETGGEADNQVEADATRSPGWVKAGPIPGEATIMARYMNIIAVCHVCLLYTSDAADE